MGSLLSLLPFTYTAMLVGSLSLLATPWLTGFYSKDLILELAYGTYSFSGTYAFILGTITAGLTAYYSVRLLSLVFLAVPNGSKSNYDNSHEANMAVILSLLILAIFSIFIGYLASDLFTGIGSDFFGNSLFILPNNISLIDTEFSINPIIKLLPLIVTIIGAVSSFVVYNYLPIISIDLIQSKLGIQLYSFFNSKYYFDVLYNYFIIGLTMKISYALSIFIDRGIIELIGPNGISTIFNTTGQNIENTDNGIVTTYALYTTLSLISLIFIVFAPILIDTSINTEFRLLLIYFAALIVIINQNN